MFDVNTAHPWCQLFIVNPEVEVASESGGGVAPPLCFVAQIGSPAFVPSSTKAKNAADVPPAVSAMLAITVRAVLRVG